jgi:hypothetical protein
MASVKISSTQGSEPAQITLVGSTLSPGSSSMTGQVALPKPSLSTSKGPSFCELVDGSHYPVLRGILPYLTQHDLLSLRASCRRLRRCLPSTHPALGGFCQQGFSLDASRPNPYCDSGPLSREPLHCCTSPDHSHSSSWHSIIRVTTPYWMCQFCMTRGITGALRYWFKLVSSLKSFEATPMGRFAPLCDECYQALGPMATHANDSKRCSCFEKLEKQMTEQWFCSSCARHWLNSNLSIPAETKMKYLRSLIPKDCVEGQLPCVQCERICVPRESVIGHFMCVLCKDLLAV